MVLPELPEKQPQAVAPEVVRPEHEQGRGGTVVFAERPLDEPATEFELDGTVSAMEQSEDKIENEIPLWRELSSETRKTLPQISLDVHVYAEEPEDRFVLVNLQKYREGDILETGSRIEQITPAGMVLTHNGERYRIKKQ